VWVSANEGNKRIAPAAVSACRFAGITIDHQSIEHRMMQPANFVFKCKKPPIGIGVDDFFEAKLMISNFF
jgi:hypothetical protein